MPPTCGRNWRAGSPSPTRVPSLPARAVTARSRAFPATLISSSSAWACKRPGLGSSQLSACVQSEHGEEGGRASVPRGWLMEVRMRNAEFEPERARRVLWTGVLVFRAASFVWMVLANILATAPIRHPVVGWAAVGLTGAWTAYLILVYFGLDPPLPEAFRRTSPERSGRDRPDVVLWFDLALAAGLVMLSGYEVDRSSVRIFFATTYPASAALAWGAARGRTAGLVAGLLLGVALALERQVSGLSLPHLGRDDTVSLLNGAVYYLLAGGAAGVVRRTIDQSEEQMRVIAEERERARAERERAREQASEERAWAMAERARAEEKASWVDWVPERTKVDLHKPVMNKLELAARALRRLAQLDVVPEAELILEAQRLEEIADRIRGFRDEIISPTPPKEGQASLEAAILEAASSVDGASRKWTRRLSLGDGFLRRPARRSPGP